MDCYSRCVLVSFTGLLPDTCAELTSTAGESQWDRVMKFTEPNPHDSLILLCHLSVGAVYRAMMTH